MKDLASIMEFEWPCEHCHRRPATVIFDHLSVCAGCYAELERKLVAEGGKR
jgi:protein-arginine kinase activator protein McsA